MPVDRDAAGRAGQALFSLADELVDEDESPDFELEDESPDVELELDDELSEDGALVEAPLEVP